MHLQKEVKNSEAQHDLLGKEREKQQSILHQVRLKQLEVADQVFDQKNYKVEQQMESGKMTKEISALKKSR